jgi:hypothetical protein
VRTKPSGIARMAAMIAWWRSSTMAEFYRGGA